MSYRLSRAAAAFVIACLAATGSVRAQPQATLKPASDLDAFMAKVLARRDVNRATLQQYILDDVETFEILGPGRVPLQRGKREFAWYVRDGLHVRSPVRVDGVTVGEAERRKYQEEWIARERRRLDRRAARAAARPPSADATPDADPPDVDPPVGGETPIAAPRFVSEAYFMDFKFERGNYYLAGREQLEGRPVLRIEYYPTQMFDDDRRDDHDRPDDRPDRERKKPDAKQEAVEQDIDRKMNKTARVTLWVDPDAYQIVKYTFDNVWMDFLPAGWLVRIDGIHASMSMGQPFAGVWLPRTIDVQGNVSLATGALEAQYHRQFDNYRLAEVTSTIRVPKEPDGARPPDPLPENPRPGDQDDDSDLHGPAAPEATGAQAEIVREIRVHGNASVLDTDVVALAGMSIGQTVDQALLTEAERRLKQSGKFESVEVLKRYRSLTDPTDVAILLIVHEKPGVTSSGTGTIVRRARTFGRVGDRLMFLPVLRYEDGYGFSYGGRVSTQDLFGLGEHISVPLTWGGTRQAQVELDRAFTSGPLTRLSATAGITQQENPHFRVDDQRVAIAGRAERAFTSVLRTGIAASRSGVEFDGAHDDLWTLGADAAIDTRRDPNFPRNAVRIGGGWTGLHVDSEPARIDLYTADARGYRGLFGQLVGAARVQYTAASSRLPDFERLLVGGASTLRGFRAGTFDGDRTLVTSLELRAPVTSVMRTARLGFTGFFDAAKAWDAGVRPGDVDWHQGVGGGVFLIAPFIRLNLDLAHGLTDGDTRLHLAAGFAF